MPWTEARSRDEWLAEVRRRGERIRRRRQLAVGALGAVALLVPGYAMVSLSSAGQAERRLQVAAGAPDTTAVPATGIPSVLGGDDVAPTTTVLAGPQSIPPEGPLYSTTTTEVHRRVASVNGVPVDRDDPVVRAGPPPTTGGDSGSVRSSPALPPPSSTTAPPNEPALAACPASGVRVTVTTGGPYVPGEKVQLSSTLENRSGTACLAPGRAFFRVENAAGKNVGSFAYTANYMLPVKVEPGKTITSTTNWDQQDCSGAACVQVPAGSYVAVAEWTEGGHYVERGSFQISG